MDAFFKTLMELSKQALPQEEVDYSDYEKEEETSSEEPEINYDDIIRENEELKLKLSELEQLQEEALASQSLFEGDPNYALRMVMNNELFEGMMGNKTSSLSWLNVKDKSVNINNVSGTISNYLSSLPDNIRQKLLATSGNDSDAHAKNSKHYSDKAIDLRFDKEVYNYLINDPAFKKSGLKVLDPNHGTAPHIHIEEMQEGGKINTWGYKNDNRLGKFIQKDGSVRYGWNPGKNFDVYRTVSKYKNPEDIKKYTPVPKTSKDVDFIANYSAGLGRLVDKVEYEGDKHWNIPRFLISPHVNKTSSEGYALMIDGEQDVESYKANILSDVYKYFLYQNKGNRNKSWDDANLFMKEKVSPYMEGPVFEDILNSSDKGYLRPYASNDILTSRIDNNFYKNFYTKKLEMQYGIDMPESINNNKYLDEDKTDLYVYDWLTKYKKMKPEEASSWIKTKKEEASKIMLDYENSLKENPETLEQLRNTVKKQKEKLSSKNN